MIREDDWDREPTALEEAHYDDILKRMTDRKAAAKALEQQRLRVIFGDCLAKLVRLGMKEPKARSMLGKWRAQAKNDDTLVRAVDAAVAAGSPDPVSYITKALSGLVERATRVDDLKKGSWHFLGWERPIETNGSRRWRNDHRGQVWRNPFGKNTVLAAPKDVVIPEWPDEPGVDVEINA